MAKIKCPLCAEEIQEGAIKCKHCKSDLLKINTEVETPVLSKKCRWCKKEILKDALVCSHCGKKQITWWDRFNTRVARVVKGCLVIASVIFVFIILSWVFGSMFN